MGDSIEGELFIEQVINVQKCDENLFFEQNIKESSHILAVVEVTEVVDEYTVRAKTLIDEDEMNIEFESRVSVDVGDVLKLQGSLELEID